MDRKEVYEFIDELISNIKVDISIPEPTDQIKRAYDGSIDFTDEERAILKRNRKLNENSPWAWSWDREMDYLPTKDNLKAIISLSDIERLRKKAEDEEEE